jgi:YbbR domain-containing protein
VSASGPQSQLSRIDRAVARVPIFESGIDVRQPRVELVLPDGTRLANGAPTPVVTITIRPAIATRTYLVGVECRNAPKGTACLPEQSQLSLTLRGRERLLAGLDPADLTPVLDASGLSPGEHDLTPRVSLPNGVSLVSISPGTVTVDIQPAATPTP